MSVEIALLSAMFIAPHLTFEWYRYCRDIEGTRLRKACRLLLLPLIVAVLHWNAHVLMKEFDASNSVYISTWVGFIAWEFSICFSLLLVTTPQRKAPQECTAMPEC